MAIQTKSLAEALKGIKNNAIANPNGVVGMKNDGTPGFTSAEQLASVVGGLNGKKFISTNKDAALYKIASLEKKQGYGACFLLINQSSGSVCALYFGQINNRGNAEDLEARVLSLGGNNNVTFYWKLNGTKKEYFVKVAPWQDVFLHFSAGTSLTNEKQATADVTGMKQISVSQG